MIGVCVLTASVFGAMNYYVYPLKHKDIIQQASIKYDVCPVLISAVIRTESKFDNRAVSKKGATGLMQIMPSTASYIAQKKGMETYDLFNPHDNIMMGTYYLQYLLKRFNDPRTAVIAYNAGPTNVSRWLKTDDTGRLETTPFPETNAYAQRVFNAKNFYRHRFK